MPINLPYALVDTTSMSPRTLAPKSRRDPNDRRRSDRKPYVMEAWVASPTAPNPADRNEVTSVNLSRHGVAFESQNPLAEGTYYMLEMGIGEQRIQSEVRIISCRKNTNGRHEIGAEFC